MAVFKVLAVDGGGIRGLIPALILARIEDQTKQHISDMFDLVAGTSTGGIIALGLTKPGADGKAEKSAQDVARLYEEAGATIFPSSFLGGLHVGAVRGPRYNGKGLESTLQRYFADARLQDALKPVLISSYDIEKQVPLFFKSVKAKETPADHDFPMWQVARATAAAPTYFPPERIDTQNPLQYYALVDGGVVAGNPAMCAYAEAIKMGKAGDGVLMLSLGTGELRRVYKYSDALNWGQLEWAQPVLDIVFQGSNETVDYQLTQILQADGPDQSYFRLQVDLAHDIGDMDDASARNLKRLLDLTDDYLGKSDTKDRIAKLCEQLTR